MELANIDVQYEKLALTCERHQVRRLALFGSVLRSDFTPKSDVDVLVEFQPGVRVSLLDMVDLQLTLEQLFARRVDLGTFNSLSEYLRDEVLATAQVVYARACENGLYS
jgi:hypothetical protein